MWVLVADLGCCPWMSTKGNIADIPSRYHQHRTDSEETEFAAEMDYVCTGLGDRPTEFIAMQVPSSQAWIDVIGALRAAESLDHPPESASDALGEAQSVEVLLGW